MLILEFITAVAKVPAVFSVPVVMAITQSDESNDSDSVAALEAAIKGSKDKSEKTDAGKKLSKP